MMKLRTLLPFISARLLPLSKRPCGIHSGHHLGSPKPTPKMPSPSMAIVMLSVSSHGQDSILWLTILHSSLVLLEH